MYVSAVPQSGSFSHTWVVVGTLCVLLSVSVILNIWQFSIIKRDREANATVQAMASLIEAEQLQNIAKQKAAKAQSNRRVDQLYEELEKLSHLRDDLFMQSSASVNTAGRAKEPSSPARVR
jgi:hypothetical protein